MAETLLVPERYRARIFTTRLPMETFEPMHKRLAEKASADKHKSWGIFLGGTNADNRGMPECWQFAKKHHKIGQRATLSFVLMNMVPQECLEGPIHFDLDKKSGIAKQGTPLVTKKEIWRKSVNFSDTPSVMIQSLQHPSTMELRDIGGSLKAVEFDESLLERVVVPGHDDDTFYGIEFCGSHIGHGADHSGQEGERFGGVWSWEQAA